MYYVNQAQKGRNMSTTGEARRSKQLEKDKQKKASVTRGFIMFNGLGSILRVELLLRAKQ